MKKQLKLRINSSYLFKMKCCFCCGEAVGGSGESRPAGIAIILKHDEALTIKRTAVGGFETLERGLQAIIDTCYEGRTIDREVDKIIGVGAEVTVFIDDIDGDKGEVATISGKVTSVWSEMYSSGGSCSAYGLGLHYTAILASDYTDFTRLIDDTPLCVKVAVFRADAL